MARHDAALANARLLVFAAGAAAGLFRIWPLLGALALVFGALLVWHEKVLQAHRSALRRATFFADGLQRAARQHPASAAEGPPPPEHHPFAPDLDLFGRHSLFGLLCTAQSGAGQHQLADWLLRPGPLQDVTRRQEAVQALATSVSLREDLHAMADGSGPAVHPDLLSRWAEAPAVLPPWTEPACWGCHALALVAALVWALTPVGPLPFFAVMVLQWALGRILRDRVSRVTAALEEPRRELPLLAQVIARLVQDPTMTLPALAPHCRALMVGSASAALPLARLDRLGAWFDAQKNQVFAPVAWLLMWAPHWASAAERWRARYGAKVRTWLSAVGELEALLSLAGYATEHPTDVFPVLEEGGPHMVGVAMAHPLLPSDAAVANDVRLDPSQPLLVVSGSNMSGKSTLLRTVGSAVALAWAGAPVRAASLRLSHLRLGATLRVQDSIQGGTSRFYAEVKRLKSVVDAAATDGPLLFLLDEILAGTNSHDRAIGAEAILRELLHLGAVGLVTTHDLALTDRAEAMGGVNVHFVDDIAGARLHFDYRMRPGVVQKSNALALMRAAGLLRE